MWARLFLLVLLLGGAPALQAQDSRALAQQKRAPPQLFIDATVQEQHAQSALEAWGPLVAVFFIVLVAIMVGASKMEAALWEWKWRQLQKTSGHSHRATLVHFVPALEDPALPRSSAPPTSWTPDLALKLRPRARTSPAQSPGEDVPAD